VTDCQESVGLFASLPDAVGYQDVHGPFVQILYHGPHDLISIWHGGSELRNPIVKEGKSYLFVLEQGIPLIALNLEREITQQVGMGGIESLSEAQLARLPREIDRENPDYLARIQSIFDQHPPREGRTFENFL
jgi:hypothetical protein